MIWESFFVKTVDSDVLNNNINAPQFARLERGAETQAEEAKIETKKQQMQILGRKKHPLILTKLHLRPKKPTTMLKKLNILLKI